MSLGNVSTISLGLIGFEVLKLVNNTKMGYTWASEIIYRSCQGMEKPKSHPLGGGIIATYVVVGNFVAQPSRKMTSFVSGSYPTMTLFIPRF